MKIYRVRPDVSYQYFMLEDEVAVHGSRVTSVQWDIAPRTRRKHGFAVE